MAPSQALAIREPGGELIATELHADPAATLEMAGQVASALQDVLEKQNLLQSMGGDRQHVLVDGMILTASFFNHTVQIAKDRRIELDGGFGWEAHAELLDQHGRVVSTAIGMAMSNETNRAGKNPPWTGAEYSVRSMASTRATSRVVRTRFGFVLKMAGYDATPAAEMPTPDDGPDPEASQPPTDKQPAAARKLRDTLSGYENSEAMEWNGRVDDRLANWAHAKFGSTVENLNRAQFLELLTYMADTARGYGIDPRTGEAVAAEPAEPAAQEPVDEAPEAPEPPPEPAGTTPIEEALTPPIDHYAKLVEIARSTGITEEAATVALFEVGIEGPDSFDGKTDEEIRAMTTEASTALENALAEAKADEPADS